MASAPGGTTTSIRSGPDSRQAATAQSINVRPRISCRTFGVDERMRVP